MTISNQTNRTSILGTAAEQEIPFLFPITSNSDITVIKRLITTGVETAMAETTDYTVTNNGDDGGSITTVTPFIAATYQIHIIRNTPMTQALDLTAGGSFNAENVEDAFDKNTKLIIENSDAIARSLVFPDTDAATSITTLPNSVDRASKNLTFDAAGTPTASVSVETGAVTFTATGTSIAEAATTAAVRTLLSLGITDTATFGDLRIKGFWHDVIAYGAGTAETGATNATAIQAAVDAAELVGGTVFFPPGIYEVDTQITMDAAGTIWGPGATIRQEDSSDQTAVLKIDVAADVDVTVFIKVDGNMDNNTAVEGIVLQGLKHSAGWINVMAEECDTGIVVEGNTEANVMFLKATDCTIGVLERADGADTPDENTLFVSGHTNATHYKKESADLQITSHVHLQCETSSAEAVIIDSSGTGSAETTLSGRLRGCADTGVSVTGSANTAIFFDNLSIMQTSRVDNGWGVLIDLSDHIRGSVSIDQFDGGFWLKQCSAGSLHIWANGAASLPGIRLGDTGSTTATRFTVLPGSWTSVTTGPALHLSQTSYCDLWMQQIYAGTGNYIEFETTSHDDTIRLPGKLRYTTKMEENGTTDHTITYYGGYEEHKMSYENQYMLWENDELTYVETL